ncbi:terminase [Dyella telluris]|uniref:Terminase n=2 Tax=Dyella telluris TaxID=2763498 RepID=A0A7G8QA13_9GAMM|nr:terminase [Dyella telluris]
MEVYRNPARFRTLVAGRRFGKTTLALSELRREGARANPGDKIWYVAPTYGMAREIMWNDLKATTPPDWVDKYNETLLQLRLVNGALISLKGADRPDTLRGVGLNFVVLDEYQDMRTEVWEQVLRPTLATTEGRALFIGTPKSHNLLYENYAKGVRQRNRKNPEWASWQFPTIASPFVPMREIEQARSDLDPRTFRQEYEASFETMSGRVYYPFERSRHVGNYPFNPKLPIWIGQDFNISPMSAAVLQPQPNGELWVVDEIVLFNSNVTEVCDELEKRYWRNMSQITIFPDPAGGSRSHARGESALDIFRSRGFKRIMYHKKHPFVQDRVNSVNALLRSASNQVRLKVNEKCRATIEAFEQVTYREGTTEIDKSLNKEHIADGIGYAIEYNFPTRKTPVLGVSF